MQGMVAVGNQGGGGRVPLNPTCIPHLWPPKPITVTGPSLGHTMSNIYCLEFFWSQQPLANREASQGGRTGV